MNINFPPVDEKYIQSMVKNGYYSNATELVRDAVRRLREKESAKEERWLAAIKLGEDDIKAGRTVPYTPKLLDKIMKNAIKNAKSGKKLNPDVCP